MIDSDTVSCPNCGATVGIVDVEPLARVPCPKCGERIRATRLYNHFELRETLGTGGMGTVYKAHDMQLDRDVALKLLRRDLGPDYANQLQREARITASVNHPHVVQVFFFGCDHDQYYLVMELVERGTLDDLIAERKKLTEEEILRTGIEVARGLRAAYRKGLIHRDVKPANILFNDDGMAKISDFGLAGIVEHHPDTSDAIWGTPYYVAPERLNNQPEDFRSDIYSLGATLFHALAGCPPFLGETMSAADLRALKNNPLKLSDVAPEVSRPTAAAIARMIAPDPRLRFSSHDAVIQALQNSERILRREREPWRRKATIGIAAATLFAVVVFSWIFFVRSPAPAKPAAMADTTLPSSINGEFNAGLRQIVDGNYPKARATFARLASETKNKQPIYDWALLNEAVAALLDQQDSIMHKALSEVENAGTNNFADASLGRFLHDTAKRANARSAVALSDVPDHAAKPFALFLLGLTDVQLGRFNEAEALLTSFVGSQSPQTLSWIGEYKPIARKYLADSQDILRWREQYGAAKTKSEITRALDSLQDVIGRLQKNTAISAEALLSQKTLAARLRDREMPNKSGQKKQHRDLPAREIPPFTTTVEAYQQLVGKYDFGAAAAVMRTVTLTDPSLKQTQNNYQNVAVWLAEWKTTLIDDLNTHGYNDPVVANNTQYSGVSGATPDKLRMKLPYGVVETDWLKVPPPILLTISSSFATDADRQWRCGVFAWATGQAEVAQKFLDAASSAKPSYREARKFFDRTKH
jgi:eukaryotic-like serine/threonine-protein kinase